jgi:hypothetical protein
MIHRLAIPTTIALLLGACASYYSGYYAPGHAGYGDYYYDNPQIIVDEYCGGGPYWGGYYDYGYPSYGFGYGLGYFPGDCFGSQFGYGPGFYGGYYPWWYGGYYRRHHHDHDHDRDDQGRTVARNDGMRHEASQFSDRNGVFGTPVLRTPDPHRQSGAIGDARMGRLNPQLQSPWEPRRESRQDLPRHHRDTDGNNP